MSEYPCTIVACPRLSRVLCYCCKNNYCIEHIKDHNNNYLSQLYQLTNEINLLSEHYRDQYRQQLDQWRHESHKTIDLYYEKKCQELDSQIILNDKLKQNRQVIEWIKSKLLQLIREQNNNQQQIDSLKAAMNALKRELNEIPREYFQLHIPPLIFDENFIHIENSQTDFNLYSTIKSKILSKSFSTNNCIVMTNNSKYFLIGQEKTLCLFDKNFIERKHISWNYGSIWDMCCLNNPSKFLLLSENGMFIFDDQIMLIEQLKNFNQSWYCCASSDKSLFLTTQQLNTTVNEYVFVQNNFLLKQKHRCCLNNEYIEHMKCSKQYLALIILDHLTGQRRLDMRSLLTFNQIWTISLNIQEKTNIVSCCSLNEKGWLIVDLAQKRLIHITNQGQIKQTIVYESVPQYALMFNEQTLAVLTDQGINLHQIEPSSYC